MTREHVLKIYDSVIAKNPNFERKGKTMPYTSANGYMFSQINKNGELGVRLPKVRQQKLDLTHGTKPFTSHGATMRDYVKLTDDMISDVETLARLLQDGFEFVMSLPPK